VQSIKSGSISNETSRFSATTPLLLIGNNEFYLNSSSGPCNSFAASRCGSVDSGDDGDGDRAPNGAVRVWWVLIEPVGGARRYCDSRKISIVIVLALLIMITLSHHHIVVI
jgi:hypothetical protein